MFCLARRSIFQEGILVNPYYKRISIHGVRVNELVWVVGQMHSITTKQLADFPDYTQPTMLPPDLAQE